MKSIASCFLLFVLGAFALADNAADRAQLTNGVGELIAPGCIPGSMSCFGKNAFVVITAQSGPNRVPVFVATTVGKGKAIAGGHEGFFSESSLANRNNHRFLINSIEWLTGRAANRARVGIFDTGGIRGSLEDAGATVVNISRANLAAKLSDVDVLSMNQGALDRDVLLQKAVTKFVQNGGGLLISGPAWGWMCFAGDKSLSTDHTGNAILQPFGVAFNDGYVDGPYSSEGAEEPLLNADDALTLLKSQTSDKRKTILALSILERLIGVLPNNDKKFIGPIEELAKSGGETIIPTYTKPITAATPLARLNALLDARRMRTLPAFDIKAHPAAKDFPGEVPLGSPSMPLMMVLDTKTPGWRGTGLYAVPGKPINVVIDEKAAGKGLSVRIGCHTDTLWGLDRWQRFPEISLSRPLNAARTQVVNPFGGTVYIEVPDGCNLGAVTISITSAVQQPRYVRGKTPLDLWKSKIRNAPGPWAELEGKYVILSVPSSSVRDLDDPEALMAYWDKVMEACYKIYAAPIRNRPERFCVDRQISAGYMHSGYPIMTWEDVANTFCNLDQLSKKGVHLWGFYHEMGHNFQEGDWTFGGTGEVTNNLFSVYGQEAVVGLGVGEMGLAHPALKKADTQAQLLQYLDNGAKFSEWQNNPFLALYMYMQMREAFGWEPFLKVFAEYRALPAGQHPRTDDEKRDQWMIRMSRAVGKNLGPFFVAWGVPTSESARKSIADLPSWMPADWPKK